MTSWKQRLPLLLAALAFVVPTGPAAAQFTLLEPGFCVTELPPGVGAKAGECSPGGVWGTYVYFSDSNGNSIDQVDPADNMFLFASGPPDIAFPVGLVFGPGPANNFGTFLYVACYGSNRITRLTPAGVPSLFANITAPGDVKFDPTGAYGTDLFATTAFAGPISTITPGGVVSTFSPLQATYIRFGPGGAWGTGLYSTSHGAVPGVGIAQVDAFGSATLFSGGFTTPEGFDWGFGPGFGGDMFAPDLNTGEIWRVDPTGNRTLFATVPASSSVTWCNGVLYVTSFAGGCWKIEFCGVTPVEESTWTGVKTKHLEK